MVNPWIKQIVTTSDIRFNSMENPQPMRTNFIVVFTDSEDEGILI